MFHKTSSLFPEKGRPQKEVLSELQERSGKDIRWKEGRSFAYVYQANKQLDDFVQQAYLSYMKENPVNPGAFPGLKQMAEEVVNMAGKLFHLPKGGSGTFTSGGSESIFLAVLAARNRFLKNKPNRQTEIVIPSTGHPAFHKAAHYFGMKARIAPVNKAFEASPQAMQALINENTALLVASAPSFPHGIVDPIAEIGKVAIQHDIPLHVDACVGGFVLPFLKRGGVQIPDFDFAIEGVSSLSADLHKYGYAAKGASLVFFRKTALRRESFFAFSDWPGGLYGSTHITGSRSGGAIAAAWALIQHLGLEGYTQLAMQAWEARQKILSGLAAFPELYVLGKPQLSLFALASDQINIYDLADQLGALGWYIERQQAPPSLHFNITAAHQEVADDFLQDVKKALEKMNGKKSFGFRQTLSDCLLKSLHRLLPEKLFTQIRRQAAKLLPKNRADSPSAPLYGMTESLKKTGNLEELIKDFLE